MTDPREPSPDLLTWRDAERQRLIVARMALPQNLRVEYSDRLVRRLTTVIGTATGRIVSFYWPFRGEPDLRPLMATLTENGATCLLPVVIAKATPLSFRAYKEGDPLERGVWNIPIPAHGPAMIPDVIIAPVVGFDRALYRLGYGGGFFDRTIASLPVKPRVIGVGYEMQAIPTIHPQSYDVPMDIIVTENRTLRRSD